MTINSLSNTQPSYLDSIDNNSGTSQGVSNSSAPATLPQDSTPQISPAASFLSQLQQLQQQDPAEFQQVTSNISNQLRQAAQTATSNGNTTQATQLNKLADQFQSASNGGAIPSLQGGGVSGHHHHHHGHHSQYGSNSSQGTTDTQMMLENLLGSTPASGSTGAQSN